jgi:alpha-amylase
MSSGDEGWKWMEMGRAWAGKSMRDLLGRAQGKVEINQDGWGRFVCGGRSVSVWGLA